MGHHGLGLMLVAIGVLMLFSLSRFWAHTKRDPRWIWRGELGGVIGEHLGPSAIQFLNAILLISGALLGTASLSVGLLFLRWF